MSEPILPCEPTSDLPPLTAPQSFTVSCRGFESPEHAQSLGMAIGDWVKALSADFDLATLDGVTVAHDYAQALLEFDRGYAATTKLVPTELHAVGVAMTPSLIRDGKLMSHIFLNALVVWPLSDQNHPEYATALHVLAHECAHVEITSRFEQAFPGVSLRHSYKDVWAALRGQSSNDCWNEYAATRYCARYGRDPTLGYEETFLTALRETRGLANGRIKAYRTHRDVGRVLDEVYVAYGQLLKFAAYCLGNLDGRETPLGERTEVNEALDGHWFQPYFERLHVACRSLHQDYGIWTDMSGFEVISDIADEVVELGGLKLSRRGDQVHVDIPYSRETVPGL